MIVRAIRPETGRIPLTITGNRPEFSPNRINCRSRAHRWRVRPWRQLPTSRSDARTLASRNVRPQGHTVPRPPRERTRSALTAWFDLLRFPPIPDLPEPLRGRSFVSFDLTYLGDADAAEELLAPVRELRTPMIDTLAPVQLSRIGDILQEPLDPMPALERFPAAFGAVG
jgi:hypothetical protein